MSSTWKSLGDLADKLRGRPTPHTTYGLEELVGVTRRKTKGDERLPKSSIFQSRAEKLYRLDPLIFSGVNRLTRLITAPKIIFIGGSDEDNAKMDRFIKQIKLRKILREAIRDAFIYGYSTIQIIYNVKGDIEKLQLIDPTKIDFQKEHDGTLKRDANDEIKGFKIKETSQDEVDVPRNEIIHIKFFGLGEDSLGITPLEPSFKAAWIRLNLEESLGEAIYRHGYPIFYFKVGGEDNPVTPDLIKEAKSILKDFNSVSELILPHWIEPGALGEKTQIGDISESLKYFAGELAHGMDIPKAYLMASEKIILSEEESIDFAKTIQNYQEILVDILEEQLFSRWIPYGKMVEKPIMTFEAIASAEKMSRARRISTLTQRGVLTRDDKMENQIRKEEGLPGLEKLGKKDYKCLWDYVDECPAMKKGISPEQMCHICKYRIEWELSKKKKVSIPEVEE